MIIKIKFQMLFYKFKMLVYLQLESLEILEILHNYNKDYT